MKKLLIAALLGAGINCVYASPEHLVFSNPYLAEAFSSIASDNNSGEESWDVAGLRTVLQNSDLYKILMPMNVTLPNTAKTSEYVMMLNEVHQMNHNLDLILQELQKINGKL
ncbi:MAG: hypothetical protein ACO1N3_04865 [Gammaproteobacteria bacterium]